MDNLKPERLPKDPLYLAPQFPVGSSSHGGSSAVRSDTSPIGTHMTSLSTVCGPHVGLWSYDQSSYQVRQEELEAESESEDESAARMQSLVPSGLLQDDRDSYSLFPSQVEVLSDTNQIESRHQEFLVGEVYQSYMRTGFVGARRDQRFDSYRPSDHVEGVAVHHPRTRTGGHDPNSAGGRVGQNSAGRYVDRSRAGGYVSNPGGGHVPAPAEGYFQCIEAIRRAHESALIQLFSLSSLATSGSSTPGTMHPGAWRVQSSDLRQENSSALSRSASRSLRNTPEKKPDGCPSNSYSPPRQKSTSASSFAKKALIAQGEKSISVLLKPEHCGSRGRSSHSASPSISPASNPVSQDSGSLSQIHPRRLNMLNIDDIPTKNPSLGLDVCNQGQFKTELCNNWQVSQWCRYGDHCRFSHGVQELRCVLRHHRYKSVPCRMIMSGKECIYGHRCHYRHPFTEKELSIISEAELVPRTTL